MSEISIIIPAYNAEKTIAKTVRSVFAQTFTDWELIIINDGSQDGTLDVLKTWVDERVKVFSFANAGPQKSRNRGLELAQGNFVAFLDADDLWTPDKLASQYEALQANPQAGVAYSWVDLIDENDQVIQRGSYLNYQGMVYDKLLVLDFVGSGSNPLIRKAGAIEVGGFDESIIAAQDWDMWLSLAATYEFVCVPIPQVLYRVVAGSWSANLAKAEQGSWQVLEKALARLPASRQYLRKEAIANRYKYHTFKALDNLQGASTARLAWRFWWQAISHDPLWWWERKKLTLVVLGKMCLGLFHIVRSRSRGDNPATSYRESGF